MTAATGRTRASGIADALVATREAIAAACRSTGRRPDDVRLVAASKTVPVEVLEQALDAGQSVFGENRVQEAAAKWPALRERRPDLELHLIGPLQSNKARDAVRLFDVVQSVDRLSLCTALAREIDRQQRSPRLLLQVNIGEEPQKSGVAPDDLPELVGACTRLGLDVTGLMCIPPAGRSPVAYFERLVALADAHDLRERSMGMSGDYADAVRHGATMVRVGSSLFGSRPPLRTEGAG